VRRFTEDIAIMGFSDDLASIIDWVLSTVTHPAFKMGEHPSKENFKPSPKTF
jgi:DNA-binding LacI/PurR family transcriptional regulator